MIRRIGNLAEIRKGKSLREDPKGKHTQIPGGAIGKDGHVDRTKGKKVKLDDRDEPTIMRKNDVMLTVDGTINKAALIKEDGLVCGSTCALIRPRKASDGKIILDYLRNDHGQSTLMSLKKGATIPHINISDVKNIVIP